MKCNVIFVFNAGEVECELPGDYDSVKEAAAFVTKMVAEDDIHYFNSAVYPKQYVTIKMSEVILAEVKERGEFNEI